MCAVCVHLRSFTRCRYVVCVYVCNCFSFLGTHQQQDLRRQERTDPPEEGAAPDPHGADHGGEDLARVDEDAAEAAHHGSLSDQRQAGGEGRNVDEGI